MILRVGLLKRADDDGLVDLCQVEQVRQRLLDVALDLVDLDLLGRVDGHPLHPGPDLVLIGLRALKCGQLLLEHRVELAAVVQLVVLGRLLDRVGLVALARHVVCHRLIDWRVTHLRCHDRDYPGNTYQPRRHLIGCDRDFCRVVAQRRHDTSARWSRHPPQRGDLPSNGCTANTSYDR